MSVYVMSDIHGEYDKYAAMLKKIGFSDDDMLYIIGDVVDRGEKPVEILLDMMQRSNVFPIMGNHDLFAFYVLSRLSVDITEENAETHLNAEAMNLLIDWIYDGGETTLKGFRKLSPEQRAAVLEYMSGFPLYDIAEVNGRIFVLVHAGLGNFRPDRKLRDYTAEELLSYRPTFKEKYYSDEDVYVICGHTPTLLFTGKAEIFRSGRVFYIDCAACSTGKLACLCLDTMEEYYI